MRELSEKELFYERLGERFAEILSDYDTQRRVEILIDEFLGDNAVRGKKALDVGCGLGFFSHRLQERGAIVTACDIAANLLELTRKRVGCECVQADALKLAEHFGTNSFDLVVSSECIEHTPSPIEALTQMVAVLKPAGFLAISTPNRVWRPVVTLATAISLRQFDGYENFISWRRFRKAIAASGARIIYEKGLHIWPFQLGFHRFSRWADHHLQVLRPLMINMCVLAQKLRSFDQGRA
jgi:2-polyprenyl-6-hydroxyphenyl methylase/3-demethylubiquinone-9 3-methyltransferase